MNESEFIREAQQFEHELTLVHLDNGETLADEFRRLKKKIQLRTEQNIFILDVIVPDQASFEKMVAQSARYLSITEIRDVASSDYEAFKKEVSMSATPLLILQDKVTANEARHSGWIHSQDQGFKESPVMRDFMTSHGKRVVLMRLWDANNHEQLKNIYTLDDFHDSVILPI